MAEEVPLSLAYVLLCIVKTPIFKLFRGAVARRIWGWFGIESREQHSGVGLGSIVEWVISVRRVGHLYNIRILACFRSSELLSINGGLQRYIFH